MKLTKKKKKKENKKEREGEEGEDGGRRRRRIIEKQTKRKKGIFSAKHVKLTHFAHANTEMKVNDQERVTGFSIMIKWKPLNSMMKMHVKRKIR